MNNMLSEALQEFTGLLNQLMKNLLGNEAELWGQEFRKFLRKEACWVTVTAQIVTTSILEFVGTVTISATKSKFVAKEKFVKDIGPKAEVKISYLGDNFKEWFLSGKGKIEDPIGEQTLRYAKLKQRSVDGPIITKLGGQEKSKTTLSEVYGSMLKQPNGENGALLNNGWWNIFYVEDSAGVLRAVSVYWSGDGWLVYARSVGNPDTWYDGSQVFSRN